MRRAALFALSTVGILAAGGLGSARADDATGAFTPQQRDAIVAIVRQAMVRDPSILADAINALRAADQKSEASAQASSIAANRAALLDPTGDAVAGNTAGRVTLVEFYDPRCPYCRRMVPVLDAAIAGDPHLRVVWRLIPILGPNSVLEARAILAAGRQGHYAAMQAALMNSAAPATQSDIEAAARRIGVDPTRLAADMADPSIARTLRANLALATALGADGTPTLVIGDTVLPGLVDAADLRTAIRQARG